MDEGHVKQEVKATYEAYHAAFRAADIDKINALVRYPFAFIDDGVVQLLNAFPINPAELVAKKEWHSTIDVEYDVVAVSPTKAHVVLKHTKRLRKDGSVIETISAFYAFTNSPKGWRLFAISGITIPAV